MHVGNSATNFPKKLPSLAPVQFVFVDNIVEQFPARAGREIFSAQFQVVHRGDKWTDGEVI